MLIFSLINFPSIFSQKFRHATLSNNAFEYNENIWLNQKKIEGTIFTDLRTRYNNYSYVNNVPDVQIYINIQNDVVVETGGCRRCS